MVVAGYSFFEDFFSWATAQTNAGELFRLFVLNIKIALVTQAIILVTGLLLAIVRQTPGRAGLPLRWFAIAYTDFFRGVPLVLLILAFAFGGGAAHVPYISQDPVYLGALAIIVSYTAYVAEVYRAGIDSVHSSQIEAARSLGMTHLTTLRIVVLPQAVKRVVPPLLNDFIALTKDTALLFAIGVNEALNGAQNINRSTFSNTGFTVVAIYWVLVTIPLARLVDMMIARQRRRTGRNTA
jgi:polar amino acid transport system permease protein